MNEPKFRDKQHRQDFYGILKLMGERIDCYHQATAYLLSLDTVCVKHIDDIFNFAEDSIKPYDALNHGWQTGTSTKTTRLMFNLWNSFCYDCENSEVKKCTLDDGSSEWLPSKYFSVDEIFCCEYAKYYWEAIKLRYPEYTI